MTSIRRDVRTRKASSHHRLVAARHESGGCSLAAPASSRHVQARKFSGDSSQDGAYSPEQRREDHKHCVELVQTRDSEGYLCGLLMPSTAREAYFALRAFNVEIASIKDSGMLVAGRSRARTGQNTDDDGFGDSTLASRLRMQWWNDAIKGIYEEYYEPDSHDPLLRSLVSSRKHNPTLRSLGCAIKTHGLTHRFLKRIIDAREADLDISQYESLRDMARYGEDTVSNTLYLALESVGVRDEESELVASDVGVGLGILTALRSTGFRVSQGECTIPVDLAKKNGITMDTMYSVLGTAMDEDKGEEIEGSRESLRAAAREMADMASLHLHRARDGQTKVAKAGRSCLLPAVCGLQYLNSLKRVDYDVLHPSLMGAGENAAALERRRRLGLMFYLGRSWLTGIF